MLLPLGLGLHFPRLPYLTLGIALILIVRLGGSISAINATNEEIKTNLEQSGMTYATARLYVDYCLSNGLAQGQCFEGAKIVEQKYTLGQAKKSKQKAKSKATFASRALTETFLQVLEDDSSVLENLKPYRAYERARGTFYAKMGEMQKRRNLYSVANKNFDALVAAQLDHAGFSHLFGNLFALLVFGAYVEMRMTAITFLLTYILGGTLGIGLYPLFFPSSPWHIVGASANISALMGAFFVLFFSFRMKFWIWTGFSSRTFYASVAIFFPILYILTEVLGLRETSGIMHGGVAHAAHLVGLIVGVGAGLFETVINPLKWPFIYSNEPVRTKELKSIKTLGTTLRTADKLIEQNPENVYARYFVFKRLLKSSKPLHESAEAFFFRHFSAFASILIRRQNPDPILETLDNIPLGMSMVKLLATSGKPTVIRLADLALDEDKFFLAIRLYDTFVQRFPGALNARGVKLTLLEIINRRREIPGLQERLVEYVRLCPESCVRGIFIVDSAADVANAAALGNGKRGVANGR